MKIYEKQIWKTWGPFVMAMSDRNEKFQKMLADENVDGILKFFKKKLNIDPLDAIIFVLGYSGKEYELVRDYVIVAEK